MYISSFEFLLEYYNYDYNKCLIVTFISFIICIFLIILDRFIEKIKKDKK